MSDESMTEEEQRKYEEKHGILHPTKKRTKEIKIPLEVRTEESLSNEERKTLLLRRLARQYRLQPRRAMGSLRYILRTNTRSSKAFRLQDRLWAFSIVI